MIKIKNNKLIKNIYISLFLFFIISILTLYSTSVTFSKTSILYKQLIWYIIGFIIIFIIKKININNIFDNSFKLYIIFNIILLLLFPFGSEINGSKSWFIIPGIGSIQPSEFMKIILILTNIKIFNIYDKKYKKKTILTDIKLVLTLLLITLVPSILTFMQPDTGMVIIYFFITFVMLFVFGIKKSIYITLIILGIILFGSFFYFFFNFENQFTTIFGTSFYYRIERLINWSNNSGMQLKNALAAIKAAGLFGYGIGNTPIYIPESHTDFIFSIFSNNFGLIGSLILILTILLFDLSLIKIAIKEKNKNNKYLIMGFIAMIIYQQIQNIAMNIGLLPITGITLPFISYGGSSLISYMLLIGIILNLITKKETK